MRQGVFIEKCRSIFSDNEGVRYLPRQKYGPGLDIQRLACADAGETRIFVKPEKRQYKDYKIGFVMDASGSMDGSKMEIMVQAVHAMAYSLTVAGASVFGISFNASIQDVPHKTLFKLREFSKIMYSRMRTEGGCNRDGAAVKHMADMMLALPVSPAKIIVVFSDGSPTCGTCHAPKGSIEVKMGQSEYLLKQVKDTRNKGLELLAVGIQSNSVPSYYGIGKSVIVNSLNELYSSTMQLLEKNIRRG
jgi:cobalamin biosynthesis protein CobT